MFRNFSLRSASFWIVLAFAIWIVTFWDFLTGKLSLIDDATSYYEHTKFFVENLAQGIFPLWDPFWHSGTSNDFFLRRIGSFNPLYLLMVGLKAIGVPYQFAYLGSITAYYWGGMIGFYLLVMRIYNNRFLAYAGYLILLFSALGTRLFDSYMMLVTVPIIWFFYFLTAFSQAPKKYLFLGIVLSFMILMGTYIPFYFLFFLGIFLVCFTLFYIKQLPVILGRYINFLKTNKLLVALSIVDVWSL